MTGVKSIGRLFGVGVGEAVRRIELGMRMLASGLGLCICLHGARAATRSTARTLGRGHARSLCTASDVPGVKERTLVAVKPDGVQRRLIGEVIKRFEQRGFQLVGLKMLQASDKLLAQHYISLQKKPFYSSLLYYMTSGPVVAMVWEGHNVVRSSRMLVGDTDPAEASPGTIRGDFSAHISRNVVHASDSVEGAEREISLWFQSAELVDWEGCDHKNIYHMHRQEQWRSWEKQNMEDVWQKVRKKKKWTHEW